MMTPLAGRSGPAAGPAMAALASLLLLATAAGAGAQALTLKSSPSGAELICEPQAAPVPAGRAAEAGEVDRLTNAATQAMILGDLSGALEFLNRALQADPGAAEAVYLRARILYQQNRLADATVSFCRYLTLAPTGPSAGEARQRLDEALGLGIGRPLLERFRQGLELHASGRLDDAEQAFTDVLGERPGASSALYNRGLIRAQRGRSGAARSDLLAFLDTDPSPADATAVRQVLGDAGGRTSRLSPGAAFAAGIFPGGGQFYTGRPVFGVVVTVATAGVVAGGVFYERTTIRCRDASAGRDCPEELIAGRDTDRPYLVPALGAAAGVALIAAVEAALHAGRDRRRSAERTTGAVRLGLDGRVAFDGQDVHVGLLRMEF